ncbi:macro domain-containing protein [Steroidobacter flavus]|uniref:Macro domain-containing protein n=1 Tax=Steroidobacter flavus TaxID=1842136 RepID=A0ABV8SNX4_9GAMM
MMFKVLIGNLFESEAQTLVNTVNCVGVMGKGVALEFKKRFPEMFDDYVARCERKTVQLGKPYLYADLATRIVNFPTKAHWRSPSKLEDIEQGLNFLVDHIQEWQITSIAMPPLGCGNGGLDWAEVGPLIYRKLGRLPIDVEVYAPYGTPKTQLSEEFLSAPSQMSLEGKGRKYEKPNPHWVTLVEALRELEHQPYAPPVGRVIFQKICYVLTEMGVRTGFEFGKGSYGPFSENIKSALHDFANRNWLHEEQLGRMLALRVGDQYERDRSRFVHEIDQHRKKISKVVDLFSRIKTTEQAEEVITVLFASRELKKDRNSDCILDEDQLVDFILDWKKSWDTSEKREAIAAAVRNLAILGWMRVHLSDEMEGGEDLPSHQTPHRNTGRTAYN